MEVSLNRSSVLFKNFLFQLQLCKCALLCFKVSYMTALKLAGMCPRVCSLQAKHKDSSVHDKQLPDAAAAVFGRIRGTRACNTSQNSQDFTLKENYFQPETNIALSVKLTQSDQFV